MFIPLLVTFYLGQVPARPAFFSVIPPTLQREDSFDGELARLRTRGEAGEPEAQAMLGIMYAMGAGVPVNLDQALFWLRKAAEQVHPGAQVKLASMYFLGQGVPVDMAQSAGWFRKAADQGEPHAQACLGVICATGVGLPQDPVEAYALLLQAQAGGVMEGHDTFLQLKSQLTRGQIEEGNRRALDAIRRRNAGRP